MPVREGEATHRQQPLPNLIRAVCPTCREVDVGVRDARLVVVDWAQDGTCHLTCPLCAAALAKPVPPPLLPLLIRMGVVCDHPEGPPPSPPPPLTRHDLDRFLDELARFDG